MGATTYMVLGFISVALALYLLKSWVGLAFTFDTLVPLALIGGGGLLLGLAVRRRRLEALEEAVRSVKLEKTIPLRPRRYLRVSER